MKITESDRLNQAILDSLPHWAMVIQCSTRTVLFANKKAREGGAKVGGCCWDDFQHRRFILKEEGKPADTGRAQSTGDRTQCTFCHADQALANGLPIHKEITVDQMVWETWWVPLMKDIFLHYAIDITELKKAEADRLKATRLESAVQTAAAACHELNQPLQALSAKLEMLLMDQDLPLKIGNRLNELAREVARMAAITGKLAKIERYQTTEYLPGSRILDLDKSCDE